MSTDKLPDGWTRVKFADIAASITERVDDPSAAGVDRYVGLEHLDPESTTIRRWGSPSDVQAAKLRFYPGDVIYGRRRAYQRKLGVADFDGICSAHALVLRAKPAVCLPEFLPYFLQGDTFHQRALDISVGSLSPTINWKTLAVQEFALPPIETQTEILAILKRFDRVELAYQDVPFKELITSFLGHLDRRSDGSPIRPGEAGWSSVRLGEVMTHLIDQVAVVGHEEYELAGIYSYGRGLFRRGPMEGRSTQYRVLNRLHVNDFVVSKLKAWEGAVAMVTKDFDGAVLSPEFPTFRLDPLRLDPAFMDLLCRRPQFWAALGGLSSGTVNRRTRVHPTQVLTIQVLLPPLDRQRVLVEEFQELQRASSAMTCALADLKEARRAAIDSLLNAEVASVH